MTLKSCETDLEVIVGTKTQQTFHYHGAILATYSNYVDTMLSIPTKEQMSRKLSFPDIEPVFWIKMIQYLEPGGSREMVIENLMEVLEYYNKYEFQSGVKMCDAIIDQYFEDLKHRHYPSNDHSIDQAVQIALLAHRFNLPQSKENAENVVSYLLTNSHNYLSASQIRSVLPLVIECRQTLEHLVNVSDGPSVMKRSMEELALIVEEQSFATKFKTRSWQITELGEAVDSLTVEHIDVCNAGFEKANGKYTRRNSRYSHNAGAAMKYVYEKNIETLGGETSSIIVILATDPFGTAWQIVELTPDDRGLTVAGVQVDVYYKWKSDTFTTLIPPKSGWEIVEGTEPEVDVDPGIPSPRVLYSIDSSSSL